jgi:small subunit ribosomal protein S9
VTDIPPDETRQEDADAAAPGETEPTTVEGAGVTEEPRQDDADAAAPGETEPTTVEGEAATEETRQDDADAAAPGETEPTTVEEEAATEESRQDDAEAAAPGDTEPTADAEAAVPAETEPTVDAEAAVPAETEPTADAEAAPVAVPPAPVEADAAGDAAEASRVDVGDEERPAPPARAADPDPAAGPAPEVRPLGRERPDAEAEELVDEEAAPRVKPEIPGADLEPDIVPEGAEALLDEELGEEEGVVAREEEAEDAEQPIAATIDLAAGARYPSRGYITGKRKSAIARVYLQPGSGEFAINGRSLTAYFPRRTLQRTISHPLEAVGYESRMDVVAKIVGGGAAAQAGALRHGIARALLEAAPDLRGELKRRGFLTRDARVKERKKAGLKKARKRPQFSKR